MRRTGLICPALAVALAMGLLASNDPATASVKGRKLTAEALTGAAVYHLLKGHGPETLVFAGGAIYAWDRVHKAKRHVGHYHRRALSRYAKHPQRHKVTSPYRHRRHATYRSRPRRSY